MKNRLINILVFCYQLSGDSIINSSPDYIIEKFERYIGQDSLLSINKKLGLSNEIKEFISEYFKKWKI